LFAGLGLHSSAFSQTDSSVQPDQVFRVSVDLVLIDAQVIKKKTGRPVTALQRQDFELYENRIRQQITSFSQDELPLSIVFLFDLTDSVRPVLKSLAEGALRALQHLKPEDEASVMVYAASTQLLQDFTTDRQLIVDAIRRAGKMESPEAAFFNEGIFQAAGQLKKASNPSNRRVIVWLTDNIPNIPSEEIRQRYARKMPPGSIHTQADALAELFKTGTVVCTLLERSDISESQFMEHMHDPLHHLYSRKYPPGDVYKYAQETGGQVFEPNSTKQVGQRLSDLIDLLRTRYALGYRPSTDEPTGKFYEVKLAVTREAQKREGKLLVRTRRGFYR
jgi:VWFA-related protein